MTTEAIENEFVDSIIVRSAPVAPAGLDESTRSVACVMSTENPVMMRDWGTGEYIDEVLIADGAVFGDQIPLLDNHSRGSSLDVLGSARDIKAANGKLTCRVYVADGVERSDDVYLLIKQGHLRDVSVGYRYGRKDFVDVKPGQTAEIKGKTFKAGERTIRVVTSWQVMELSVTPIGADRLAKMRSLSDCKFGQSKEIVLQKSDLGSGQKSFEQTNQVREENQMSAVATTSQAETQAQSQVEATRTEQTVPVATGSTLDATAIERAREEGVRAEFERIQYAQSFTGIRSDLVQQAIAEKWNKQTISERYLQSMTTERAPAVPTSAPAGHVVDNSHRQENIQALFLTRAGINLESNRLGSDVFSARFARGDENDMGFMVRGARDLERGAKLDEKFERSLEFSNRYRSVHWVSACAMALDFAGVKYDRYDERDIVTRAISTMTVSTMLSNALGAVILDSFMGMDDTTFWVDIMEVPNNLPQPVVKAGNASRLKKRTSGQTPVNVTKDASQEFISAATYSQQCFIDRIDLLADRFGGLQNTPTEIGMAAGEVVPDLVYSTLLANPNMGDSNPIFSTAHGNLAVSAALGSENLAARKVAMANQTNNGRGVGAKAGFLIVPESMSHTADVLVGSSEQRNTTATTQYGTKNWAQGKFQVVSETRLDVGCVNPNTDAQVAGRATDYYLADKMKRWGLRKAFIRASNGAPIVERWSPGDGRVGIGATVELDCGLAAVGYEGLQCGTAAGSK